MYIILPKIVALFSFHMVLESQLTIHSTLHFGHNPTVYTLRSFGLKNTFKYVKHVSLFCTAPNL